MLSVGQFKKKVRRTTEKAFEELFAEVLAEKGIYNRHMSDKFSGVPDRYVAGGKWIEFKSLEYARGVVTYGAGMSIEQVRVCGEMVAGEEEVWYCALVATNKGQFVIWCPMHIVLEQEDNSWNCYDEAHGDAGWCWEYKGKETIRKLIPRDWHA